ncbi:DUF4149 domain-containing protein [Nitrospira defluvii]|nr:DUF4149 domain-containing protein [Nitrospira defluvii]
MLGVILSWLHLVVAMFWIGGTLFFVWVVIPSLREGLSDSQRTELISRIGKRFRIFGWVSLGVLLVSGTLLIYESSIGVGDFRLSLWIKLSLFFVVVLLTVVHDFILGPKSIQMSREISGPHPLKKWVAWTARLNLLFGLLVVLAAVILSNRFG